MTDLTPLTDAQLAAIAERAEKATPGPWREGTLNVWNDAELRVVAITHSPSDPSPTTENIKTHIGQRNAVFIAAARSDIPALLASHAALAARLAEAQATIERLIDAHRERQDLLTAMTQKVMEQSGQLATAQATIARLLHFASNDGRLGAYLNTLVADLSLIDKGQYLRDHFGAFSEEMTEYAWSQAHAPPAPEADDAR